jgi:hypothetical protein
MVRCYVCIDELVILLLRFSFSSLKFYFFVTKSSEFVCRAVGIYATWTVHEVGVLILKFTVGLKRYLSVI